MIPQYLQGKSAAQMVDEIKKEYSGIEHLPYNSDYVRKLEGLLLLAVKDALCACDGVKMCGRDYGLMGSEAEGRAIAFLNMVLPYENKT